MYSKGSFEDFSQEKTIIRNLFNNDHKSSVLSKNIFGKYCQIVIHRSHRLTMLKRKTFFLERSAINHSRTLMQKISTLCKIFSRRVVKTAFYVSIGSFRGNFLWKDFVFFCSFWTMSANLTAFFRKLFGRVFKTAFHLSKEIVLGKKISKKTKIFWMFCDIGRKIFGLSKKKNLFLVVKTAT